MRIEVHPGRALVAAALAFSVGCTAVTQDEPDVDEPPSAAARVGDWLGDRGLDLLDVASVRLAAGPGLLVNARVTPWIALGGGMLGRPESWAGGFEMRLYKIGWVLRGGGVWTERRAEIGISKFYYCESETMMVAGDVPSFVPESRGKWDVGAEVHAALIGVAAEVRLDQALDFVLGWFGLDLAGDDGE